MTMLDAIRTRITRPNTQEIITCIAIGVTVLIVALGGAHLYNGRKGPSPSVKCEAMGHTWLRSESICIRGKAVVIK